MLTTAIEEGTRVLLLPNVRCEYQQAQWPAHGRAAMSFTPSRVWQRSRAPRAALCAQGFAEHVPPSVDLSQHIFKDCFIGVVSAAVDKLAFPRLSSELVNPFLLENTRSVSCSFP